MIAFRVDANATVATGHLFRCISIAKCCRKAGYDCVFLLAQDEYTDVLAREGFDYRILNIKWDDWNYGTDIVKKVLKEYGAECLVVDSYRVTEDFFEELISVVPIFYMDDLCNKRYKVTATLHYSEWEQEHILADLYAGTDVQVYAGMKFMPLRENFANVVSDTPKQYQILITTGGSDSYHVTLRLLQALVNDAFFAERQICVVLGRMNMDKAEIDRISAEYSNITVFQNISNMDEVMRQSEYAVTAGGTTVYELMASGVPFVCFGFSDDQKYFGERLAEHGNAMWAGDAREDAEAMIGNLKSCLKKMLEMSDAEVQACIQKNKAVVDGYGAARIADILMDLCQKKERSAE